MHLSKLIECTTPRMNLNVSYGLWTFSDDVPVRIINCNKGTTVVRNAGNGGGCACVGAGLYVNSIFLSTEIQRS